MGVVFRGAMKVNAVQRTTAGRFAKAGSLKLERRASLVASYFFLSLFLVFFLFPPYYMIITSLKTNEEIAAQIGVPLVIQGEVTLEHYRDLIMNTGFPTYMMNTIIVSVLVVAITMVVSILTAYSLSRMRFFGSGVLSTGIFLVYLVPETLLFIPLFQILSGLGLVNTIWSLVLVYPTMTVPFCSWILIGYFASIPRELDEAAFIDGANYFQMMFRIFIPVAMPGIIAATIFAFTVCWSAFIYPLAFIFSDSALVVTAGTVSTLIKGDVFHWGGLMAGAVLGAAPPVILYVFLMDYYVSGLTAGATKG